jgi:hypothetical protein
MVDVPSQDVDPPRRTNQQHPFLVTEDARCVVERVQEGASTFPYERFVVSIEGHKLVP